MSFENLDEELEGYSLDELQEIHDTQQDLYSVEELGRISELISARRDALDAECRRLDAMVEERLPDVMECQKCGGPNKFSNVKCKFCGAVLDKSEYYENARFALYEEIRDDSSASDRLFDEAFSRFFAKEEDEELDKAWQQCITEPSKNGRSYAFHYVISVLIPLVGFIMGGILLTKDDERSRSAGKVCVVAGVISIVVGCFLWFFCLKALV